MSIILPGAGGGGGRWATLATILLMGIILIFFLVQIAKPITWVGAVLLNISSEVREAMGAPLNESVETTTIHLNTTLINGTVIVAKPANYPYNSSIWSSVNWIIHWVLWVFSQPVVWAAVIVLSMIALAISLRGQ